jgi:hypothetical protein
VAQLRSLIAIIVSIVNPTRSDSTDLGFQSEEIASAYPIAHQIASQYLTLQGAVAHTDMPLESGPTLLLPFSQNFKHGYLAYRHPAFVSFFHEHKIQLPLQRGDAVFFNPALFHAAGENTTKDFKRAANLLQVSAAWGRPMESVDRTKILKLAYRHLGSLSGGRRDAAVRAIADGYSFPTNLDKDPPPSNGVSPNRDSLTSALSSDAAVISISSSRGRVVSRAFRFRIRYSRREAESMIMHLLTCSTSSFHVQRHQQHAQRSRRSWC